MVLSSIYRSFEIGEVKNPCVTTIQRLLTLILIRDFQSGERKCLREKYSPDCQNIHLHTAFYIYCSLID